MKKILLASTALIASAGFAAAQSTSVTVGGDGYFGVGYGKADNGVFSSPAPGTTTSTVTVGTDAAGRPVTNTVSTANTDDSEYSFVYDLDIDFAIELQSDSGLSFGMKTDLDDNAGDSQGPLGHEGEIFISGDFGRLAMGDISGGTEAIIGDLAGVGLTGLGDLNENIFLMDARSQPAGPVARYDYGVSGISLSLGLNDDEGYAVGVGYETDLFSVGLGYESVKAGARVTLVDFDTTTIRAGALAEDAEHIVGQASVTFSGVTLKGVYGQFSFDEAAFDGADQYGISAESTFGAVTVAAYYRAVEIDAVGAGRNDNKFEAYGLGAAYDLGGGLSLKAGIAQADIDYLRDFTTKNDDSLTVADFGVAINF